MSDSFVTTWTVAHQAPLSTEFSRQEYWSGLPFPPPGDRPDPGAERRSPASAALAGRFFATVCSPGEVGGDARQARWTLAPPANVRKDAGAGGLQGIQEASAGKRAPQAQGTGDRAWGGGRCATETLPATTPGTERLAPATVAPGKDHLEVRVLNQ